MKIQYFIISVLVGMCFVFTAMVRYQVGENVPASVYTDKFDQQDGIYKFLQINYGDPNDPNKPKFQAAPDDWVKAFGNNERTLLFHTISEMRIIIAAQSKRILDLEKKKPNK